MGKHKHHIIPKHMGGSNDPYNVIELTIEEHAEAHKKLWEDNGMWQDFIAWKALSGQINSDDIRRELTKLTWLGRTHTEETKEKIKEARKKQKNVRKKGEWSPSIEARQKMSEARIGIKLSEETKKKIGQKLKNKPKPIIICPHCNKSGGASSMKQWHFDNCKRKYTCL